MRGHHKESISGAFLLVCSALTVTVSAGVVYIAANVSSSAFEKPGAQFTVTTPATCVLPDGGYVKTGRTIQIDTWAQNTGTCQFWYNGVHYPQYDSERNLNGIGLDGYPPTTSAWYHFYPGPWNPGAHSMDTRGTALTWSASAGNDEGAYQMRFRTSSLSTNCQIRQYSDWTEQTLNVVKCKPNFMVDSNGNIARLAPANPVMVYMDPVAMEDAIGALEEAIEDLNGKQQDGTGVVLERAETPCETGSDCVTIRADPDLDDCGGIGEHTTNGSGVLTGSIVVFVRDEWPTYTYTGLVRTFAHELQHLMGLSDSTAASCGVSDAIMQDQFNCAADVYLTTLSPTDTIPVIKASYGNGTRLACGF